jgi:hypothetical protein
MKPAMTRTPDWPLRFEAFIAERRAQSFAWGANDCAIFAADCVQAITGTDPAPAWLRLHKTQKQALRALQRHGGLHSIATAALGQPVAASQAGVGDVVLVKVGKRDALAICNGATALGPADHGLVAVAMASATACWRVA